MRAAFGRNEVEQRAELVAFAPETDDQHPARIGVLRERGEQRARMAEVVAELRTAVGVLERINPVDAPGMAFAAHPLDPLGAFPDAAPRRPDPVFVARELGRASF